ncbi:MAG: hypothetical protein MJ252_28620, partial [archaeon]|nr:hypothetical protein [archaeon]
LKEKIKELYFHNNIEEIEAILSKDNPEVFFQKLYYSIEELKLYKYLSRNNILEAHNHYHRKFLPLLKKKYRQGKWKKIDDSYQKIFTRKINFPFLGNGYLTQLFPFFQRKVDNYFETIQIKELESIQKKQNHFQNMDKFDLILLENFKDKTNNLMEENIINLEDSDLLYNKDNSYLQNHTEMNNMFNIHNSNYNNCISPYLLEAYSRKSSENIFLDQPNLLKEEERSFSYDDISLNEQIEQEIFKNEHCLQNNLLEKNENKTHSGIFKPIKTFITQKIESPKNSPTNNTSRKGSNHLFLFNVVKEEEPVIIGGKKRKRNKIVKIKRKVKKIINKSKVIIKSNSVEKEEIKKVYVPKNKILFKVTKDKEENDNSSNSNEKTEDEKSKEKETSFKTKNYLHKIFPLLEEFKPSYTKRENIDKKAIRRFRKYLLSKKKFFNHDEIKDNHFWPCFLAGNLFPPVNYYDYNLKEYSNFKSFNASYLIWLFSKEKVKEYFEVFIKEDGMEFAKSLIIKYKIQTEKEKTELLNYLQKLPKIFESNANLQNHSMILASGECNQKVI